MYPILLCRRFVICIVPVHPFQGVPFDLADEFPRPHEVDELSFEQVDCAFGQGIVVAAADAADGWIDACFCQPFGLTNGQILSGFKRSSQRFQIGGCDDKRQTRFGAQYETQMIVTRATACSVAL